MHTIVTASLHSQLYKLCQTGGVKVDTSTQFTQSLQGRIHRVYLVQTEYEQSVIQCLNPAVIKDSLALENLINDVLAPASITPLLLPWPATDKCVLHTDSGHWIRRSYIVGQAMTTQLSLVSFEAMASTLRHFHQSIGLADFEQTNFIGVNPWSGDATVAIEKLHSQVTKMSSIERAIVDEWAQCKESYPDTNNELPVTHVVVHRDAKPSNFIRKANGSLVLIDFDTIGTGDPALDLGELMRAWLSSDELDNALDTEQPDLTDLSSDRNPDSQYMAVSGADCTKAIQTLQAGYNDPTITASRVQTAAIRCCLWQCERFLEDHFAGDSYYLVQTHGDNLIRAQQQLDAFRLLYELSDV